VNRLASIPVIDLFMYLRTSADGAPALRIAAIIIYSFIHLFSLIYAPPLTGEPAL